MIVHPVASFLFASPGSKWTMALWGDGMIAPKSQPSLFAFEVLAVLEFKGAIYLMERLL